MPTLRHHLTHFMRRGSTAWVKTNSKALKEIATLLG
jgi:hypothetical protein